MKTWRPTSRLRRAVTVAAVACLATTAAAALTATPASASSCTVAAGTLCSVSLTLSNNTANVATDGTTANVAGYTWAFTTGQAATLTQLTMTVPSDSAIATVAQGGTGALVVAFLVGTTGCTAETVTLGTGTGLVTVPLSGCASTPADTPVAIRIDGFKNTATPGAASATTVTTFSGTTPAQVDTGTGSAPPSFANNTTGVTVVIPESLTFTNEGPTSVGLTPIPAGSAAVAPDVTLKVSTNAANGYSLAGCLTTAPTDGTHTIHAGTFVTSASDVSTSALGALAAVGGAATLTTSWNSTTNYTGYATSCNASAAAPIGSGVIASNSSAAAADTLTLTNAAVASATQAAGVYQGTITYLVTPSY